MPMTPFDQDEALWKLLGQAKDVQVNGNFLPNVLREARNTPQERGVWAALCAWWSDLGNPARLLPLGAAAAVVMVSVWAMQSQESAEPVVAEVSVPTALAEEPIAPLTVLDEVDALLAMEDTSALTDQEISFLLY